MAATVSSTTELVNTLSPTDQHALAAAYARLEHPSLAARLSSVIGTPIETGLKLLPARWYRQLQLGAERSIAKALEVAISSLRADARPVSHDHHYRLLGMTSGAVGGFFGLPALLIEMPISTTLMLRAIADIARSEGEPLDALDTRLACIQVFALGGRSEEDDAADTGYYGVRLALALTVADALSHLGNRGLVEEGAPALVRFIAAVAGRFGATVSEKAAAQTVPLLGAAGGAAINLIFIQHFQDMARGHFTIRRLERRYGAAVVKTAYEQLSLAQRGRTIG